MITSTRAAESLRYEFGQQAFTNVCNNYYLALSSTDPSVSLTETSSDCGYTRATIPNNTSNWTIDSDNFLAKNTNLISFPQLTAQTTDVTHWALMTALTSGTMLYYGQLSQTRPMPIDSIVEINAGDLKIYRTNEAT